MLRYLWADLQRARPSRLTEGQRGPIVSHLRHDAAAISYRRGQSGLEDTTRKKQFRSHEGNGSIQVVEHVEMVIAIELLAACQAIEFHRPLTTTPPLERVHKLVRSKVCAKSYTGKGCSASKDLHEIRRSVANSDQCAKSFLIRPSHFIHSNQQKCPH